MKTIYTAGVTSSGGREGHVRSSDGRLEVDLRPPEQRTGAVRGTDPEQLFAAAYAACFESALRHIALKRGINVTVTRVTARVSLQQDDEHSYSLAVRLKGYIEGLSSSETMKLMQVAHTVCPYSKAVSGNVLVTLAAE